MLSFVVLVLCLVGVGRTKTLGPYFAVGSWDAAPNWTVHSMLADRTTNYATIILGRFRRTRLHTRPELEPDPHGGGHAHGDFAEIIHDVNAPHAQMLQQRFRMTGNF